MSERPPTDNDSSADPSANGVGAIAANTLAIFFDYLEARFDLIRFEASEARSGLLRRLIALLTSFLFFTIAYVAGWIGLIGWLANTTSLSWPILTLLAAALHLSLALVLIGIARRAFAHSPFSDSLNELRRDRERLRQDPSPTPPTDPA